MAREQFQNLTEPMYYILLSLTSECCGVDVMKKVSELSGGRIAVGPGTLYALLARFEKERMICEVEVEGRKRTYIITEEGKEALKKEYYRLKILVDDGREIMEGIL